MAQPELETMSKLGVHSFIFLNNSESQLHLQLPIATVSAAAAEGVPTVSCSIRLCPKEPPCTSSTKPPESSSGRNCYQSEFLDEETQIHNSDASKSGDCCSSSIIHLFTAIFQFKDVQDPRKSSGPLDIVSHS